MKHHDIQYFLGLQERFIDLLSYISCHENNFTCYSVKNESLIIDICSFFDSLCQTYIRELHASRHIFKKEAEVDKFKNKIEIKSDFNAGDYRNLLEGDFNLSNRLVNLNLYEDYPFINPLAYAPDKIDGYRIVPFIEWKNDKKTEWWDSFTNLKHNRVLNHKQASLRNVVFSLAAVFVILCLKNENSFIEGKVPKDIYRAFVPKFWNFSGRLMHGIFTWKRMH
jgi:hypothetical protein